MKFYTGDQFPAEYKNNILIAEHGSWNRHKYQGARIKRVIVGPDGKNAKQEIFASGWLEGDQGYLGRPADIILAKDGSILVADDWAGAIYRISYARSKGLTIAGLRSLGNEWPQLRVCYRSAVIPGLRQVAHPGMTSSDWNGNIDHDPSDSITSIVCWLWRHSQAHHSTPPTPPPARKRPRCASACHGEGGISQN